MKHINLIAFGTFGNPNGFTQTFFLGNPIKGIKTFDIRGVLKLLPNSEVYSIRKENVNGFNLISYSKYTFALEPTSTRGGSFIGSSILFTNKICDENITIKNLNEFHQNLITKNVENQTIKVKHSNEFDVSNCKPKDFDKINYNLKEIENVDFSHYKNKEIVVLSRISDHILQQNFIKSLILLNKYDSIYFTDNIEIAELTKNKGIYKTIDETGFDIEINHLIAENIRKREQAILEFEREIFRLKDEKTRTIQDYKIQIEQSEKIHLENDKKLKESIENIPKIVSYYDDFLSVTKNLLNQLKQSNQKIETVTQLYSNNKILFNNGLSNLIKPHYSTKIAKLKPNTNLNSEVQEFSLQPKSDINKINNIEIKDFAFNNYKIATLVLSLLLIITWLYVLFSKSNSVADANDIKNQKQVKNFTTQPKTFDIKKLNSLNPIPNSVLNENDYKIVAKNLKPNMVLNEVVKVIFKKNPTEIGTFYADQETTYSKVLLELNWQCFKKKQEKYYFTNDTLKQIPSYKKQ